MKRLIFLLSIFTSLQCLQAQTGVDITTWLQENKIKTEVTPEGIHYAFTKKGSGETAKTGRFVKLKYNARLTDGTEFDKSPEGEPFVFEVGYRQVVRGLDRGIQLFPEGSKGTLYLPPVLAFGEKGKGKSVPANSPVIYDIEVVQVMDYEAYDEYMRKLEESEKEEYLRQEQLQLDLDKRIIKNYANVNKLKIRELPSGVAFAVTKRGKGPKVLSKSLVHFNYEGYLPNGNFFDGEGRREFKFWMGRGMAIDGIEQAMPYFQEGSEGVILIPSKFAYGQRGIEEADTYIPENSVLIFDVKILEVKNLKK